MMKRKNIFLVKFTAVAMMLGLFSPSIVQVKHSDTSIHFQVTLLKQAEARRGGVRGGGRSVKRGGNRNVNRNKNVNRNVNRNVNVNVNNRYYGGHHGHYGSYHGHPILAFATVMAVGSIVAAATMPTTCTTVVTNGVSYRRCGSSYYQPFYQGDTLVYKVVNSPY